LAIEHRQEALSIGGIAVLDDDIEDQAALAGGENADDRATEPPVLPAAARPGAAAASRPAPHPITAYCRSAGASALR
jgi:hypothetical protein